MASVIGLHHVAFAHEVEGELHLLLEKHLGLQTSHVESADGFIERMIPVGGPPFVQTLEVCGPGVIERFVERRGPGLHHVAFEVDDLAGMLSDLGAAGVRLVDDRPRPGGMGHSIAFVHPSSFGGLLLELVEATDEKEGRAEQ